jgi:beta-N-acetylhexosaminidase
MKINRKAVIFGISSYRLRNSEKIFFNKVKPWGIILFSRNIKSLEQLRTLVKNIKKIFKDDKFPILIDVEGGKVSRLKRIIDLSVFSQTHFAKLYKDNKKSFYTNYKIFINGVSSILNFVGININTVPVLDVRRSDSHNFIGTRSFSNNQNIVSHLGKICVDLYKENKICTVVKHIPGHGLAKCDSHFKTPIIKNNKNELIKKDFKPFKMCKSIFAMTAHVIYEKYDPKYTVTHSKIVINKVIRDHIKFKGILISDDISMKSLKFSIVKNATKALDAGCNLVLHCNGKLNEMKKISKVIPKIDKFTQKKTSDFYNFLR